MRTELHIISLPTQVKPANKPSVKKEDPSESIYHVDSSTGKSLEIGTVKILKKGKTISEVCITLKNPGFIESDDLKAYLNGYIRISPKVSLNMGKGYIAEKYTRLVMGNEDFRESITKQHRQEFQSNSSLNPNFIIQFFWHMLGQDNVLVFTKANKPTPNPTMKVNYGGLDNLTDSGELLNEESNQLSEIGNKLRGEKLFLDGDELEHSLKKKTTDKLLKMLDLNKTIDIMIPNSCSYEGTGETGIKVHNSAMGIGMVLKHFFTEDEVLLKIIESLLCTEKILEIQSENYTGDIFKAPIELNPFNDDNALGIYINDFQDPYYKKIFFKIVEYFIGEGMPLSLMFGDNLDLDEFKEFINKTNSINDRQRSIDYSSVNLDEGNSKIKITFVDSLNMQE